MLDSQRLLAIIFVASVLTGSTRGEQPVGGVARETSARTVEYTQEKVGPFILRIRLDKREVIPGERIDLTAELLNDSGLDQALHMPGISGKAFDAERTWMEANWLTANGG